MKIVCFLLLLSITCSAQNKKTKREKKSKITYKTFKKDPTGLRLYTLQNGLKVYLAKNSDAPKVETLIAVKTGSNNDPEDQTGLAHYLEHMLFKGTSKMGTSDWNLEKAKLSTVSKLYEKLKITEDEQQREKVYKQIDSVSFLASKYAIANDYDKLVTGIGAEGTNAHTWYEETVYKNTIPSNEIDKWLAIEKERFSQLVLRLFHTELEAVYEEFNRGQDSDSRKQYYALVKAMFPNHPYGTQTTIGTAEHLKNPSMKAIHKYFDTYYVPNNMAIIMVGDIEFDEVIKKIDDSFGQFKFKVVPVKDFPNEKFITRPVEKVVYGPSEESIYVAYRTEGVNSDQALMITLIDYILANATAGLIDLNLNSKLKVQNASSWTLFQNDYGMHVLDAKPKEGQSLDEVKELLLEQIELVKKGAFDDWLIEAITNDMKLSEITGFESARVTANEFMHAFIHNTPWQNRIDKIANIKKITKADVVAFANDFYKENYVVVKKLVGEDPDQVKVENPKITPITIDRDKKSEFAIKLNTIKSDTLALQTLNFNEEIKYTKLKNDIDFSFIENKINDYASVNLKFPVGKDKDPYLGLSFNYLEYLGTDEKTNEELKKEFFKIGISYSVNVANDQLTVTLYGLQQNLAQGCKLFFDALTNLKVDEEAYNKLVEKILKERENTLKDKSKILFNGLMSYSRYGENSRLRNSFSKRSLENTAPTLLISKIVSLFLIKPEIFYYGKNSNEIKTFFEENELLRNAENVVPTKEKYVVKPNEGAVYFVDYDMVQAELLLLSREEKFNPNNTAKSLLYNTYFGSGLSSIVFQEIRESKSLAYAASSRYQLANKATKHNSLYAYIGTQSNKLPEALQAIKELLNEMPKNEAQFQNAKTSVLKSLAASRINKANIYWEFQRLKKLGISEDNRKEVYHQVKQLTLNDLDAFFNEEIKNSTFDLLIIGNKNDIDFSALEPFGTLKEFEPEFLFNYN